MNYKSIPPIIGCALLTIYSLAAQPQVQSIQGHRMARTADSDAPSPIPKIDGVSIVRVVCIGSLTRDQWSKLPSFWSASSVFRSGMKIQFGLSTETWYKPPI